LRNRQSIAFRCCLPEHARPSRSCAESELQLLSVERLCFDKAPQAVELLVQHTVEFRRPVFHADAGISAGDHALSHVGSLFARFKSPGERAIHALHLQGTEGAAQTQSLPGRSIDYDQMLDGTAVLQPLAKAAAGFEIETEIAGIA